MVNKLENATSASDRKYLLFQCHPSSETRGRRPSHNNGCFKWGVRMTKASSLEIQTRCRWCDNRGRKNEGTVEVFHKRRDAEMEMYKRNSLQDFYGNSTEEIQ